MEIGSSLSDIFFGAASQKKRRIGVFFLFICRNGWARTTRRKREWALSATAAGDEKRERDKGENRERREQRICEERRECL